MTGATGLEETTRADAVGAPDAYRLRALTLSQFRTYDALTLSVDRNPVVLTGANGAGKTNILEAISWLQPGRGMRNATLAEVRRRAPGADDPEPWAVAAIAESAKATVRIGTGPEPGRDTRRVRIDGETAQGPAALGRYLRLVWLTPAMDRLFSDARSQRLRFLDRMVQGFDPAHASRLSAYERASRDRMRLLDVGKADDRWLSALERTMAEQGVAAAAARAEFVRHLEGEIAARPDGAFPKAGLAIAGVLEAAIGSQPAIDLEMEFEARLAAGRHEDARAGRTLQGPHRSDLLVTHLGKAMPARECSTGEQKALLVGIVLANASLESRIGSGALPVLLLDEVAAHLDADRRAALFDEILSQGMQAWMTGTDDMLFEALSGRAHFFHVSDGRVEPVARS